MRRKLNFLLAFLLIAIGSITTHAQSKTSVLPIKYSASSYTIFVGDTIFVTASCREDVATCVGYWTSNDPTRIATVGSGGMVTITDPMRNLTKTGTSIWSVGTRGRLIAIYHGTARICVHTEVDYLSAADCHDWKVLSKKK